MRKLFCITILFLFNSFPAFSSSKDFTLAFERARTNSLFKSGEAKLTVATIDEGLSEYELHWTYDVTAVVYGNMQGLLRFHLPEEIFLNLDLEKGDTFTTSDAKVRVLETASPNFHQTKIMVNLEKMVR